MYSRPRDKAVGVPEGWRSHPSGVSVSALFDPRVVDMGGELQHVSVPLLRVLVQLDLFQEVTHDRGEERWPAQEGSARSPDHQDVR